MLSFFKKPEAIVEKQKSPREELLENEIKNLKAFIASLEDKARKCTFTFDFNAVNAFSVERNWNNGKVCTVIGYTIDEQTIHDGGKILDKQIVKEWYLYCSEEQHEKLVEEFNEHKKGN